MAVEPTPSIFDAVDSRVSFPDLERRVREFWEAKGIFQRSVEERPEDRKWVFYEGPPTANGLPGLHHVLARSFKDLFPRYKTMQGHRVVRKGGWDTHGLPVEVEVEKELGFKSKQDIEAYGIDRFNQRCKESGNRYIKEWVEFTHRVGFWLDLDNPYITYETPYMESVWSLLKTMWDQDLLYKGFKVVPYCPRCMTPLSSHELSQGYEDDVKDPSVHVLFELTDQPNTYFLAWTTTPWTLPGNVALAVGADIQYVRVRTRRPGSVEAESPIEVILAEARLELLEDGYELLEKLSSKDLVGKTYRPLYEYLVPKEPAFFVVEADFVDVHEGTGIVHTAAAYGEDDLRLALEKGIPVRHVIDERGRFLAEVEPFAGMWVKDADVEIMKDLGSRGLLYRKGTIRHTYPFCWRCGTALLYYAMDSWFIATSKRRDQLLANNRSIRWVPDHIRDGRMGDWLQNNVDWSLSRYRYWATPLPVWECEGCDHKVCVGSAAELGLPPDADLHRPHIDEVTLPCEECGATMRRVVDVIDVWFDSGAMPYAQHHWPFENQQASAEQFPADFICEAIDQTRGWFYSLLAISTLVSGEGSYRSCVVPSHVVDKDGKKMSKSKGNVVDPMEMMDTYGADALRWYFYTSVAVGNEYRVAPKMFGEVVTGFFRMLWNTYSFFVTYANIDGFRPTAAAMPVSERSLLDRWLLSELNRTVDRVTAELEELDATGAGRAIQEFVEDLSNWYVRRSRRRFWKSESDADKLSAYLTLFETLVTLSRLLAPFTPFLADELYLNLSRGLGEAADSVHLDHWPRVEAGATDAGLSKEMARARRIVEAGHKERDRAGLKVRQPLRGATVPGAPLDPELEAVVLDELNLKSLTYDAGGGHEVVLDTELTPELRREGLARELVRRIQGARKDAGYNIEDRIEARYRTDEELGEVFTEWSDYIQREILAATLSPDDGAAPGGAHVVDQPLDGHPLWLGLRRVQAG